MILKCKNCNYTARQHQMKGHKFSYCDKCSAMTMIKGERGMGKSTSALASAGNALAGAVALGVGTQVMSAQVMSALGEDLKTRQKQEEELLTDEIENILKEELKENTMTWTEPNGTKTILKFSKEGELIGKVCSS